MPRPRSRPSTPTLPSPQIKRISQICLRSPRALPRIHFSRRGTAPLPPPQLDDPTYAVECRPMGSPRDDHKASDNDFMRGTRLRAYTHIQPRCPPLPPLSLLFTTLIVLPHCSHGVHGPRPRPPSRTEHTHRAHAPSTCMRTPAHHAPLPCTHTPHISHTCSHAQTCSPSALSLSHTHTRAYTHDTPRALTPWMFTPFSRIGRAAPRLAKLVGSGIAIRADVSKLRLRRRARRRKSSVLSFRRPRGHLGSWA